MKSIIVLVACSALFVTARVQAQIDVPRPPPMPPIGGGVIIDPLPPQPGPVIPNPVLPPTPPPPPQGNEWTPPAVAVQVNNLEAQIKTLIDKYNDDEAFHRYVDAFKEARKTVDEFLDKYDEVYVVVTAEDPVDEVAAKIVENLEEKAIDTVQAKLEEEIKELDKSISDWGVTDNTHTREQKALALAALEHEGNYYRSLLAQARTQAARRENQEAASGSSNVPQVGVAISSSASAKTSSIHLTEGAALRQARKVEKQNDWSSVLNQN